MSDYMATIMDIVEHGLSGDTEKVRAYAELLLERLEQDNHRSVGYLRKILAGENGKGPTYQVCENKPICDHDKSSRYLCLWCHEVACNKCSEKVENLITCCKECARKDKEASNR